MLKWQFPLVIWLVGWVVVPGIVIPVPQAGAATIFTPLPSAANSVTTTSSGQVLAAEDNLINATDSTTLASPSATIQEKIQEKIDKDITETTGKQKNQLEAFLDSQEPTPLSWNNWLQHSIRAAVKQGVPVNVIVLVLLFPLVVSIIGASRHIIGFRGFGLYIPAVLAVALVSTGIFEGLTIFAAIVATALITKRLLKRTRISYLPRTALLLWTISLGVLAVLLAAPLLHLTTLMSVNIFPILILMLLSENFLDALQLTKPADALALAGETLGLAFFSSLFIRSQLVQQFAISEPELLMVGTAFVNILVGKFTGLRLSEFLRFRSIIEE